jgi:hypothetical protein
MITVGFAFCGFAEAVPSGFQERVAGRRRTGARDPLMSELECRKLLRSSAFGFLSDLGFRAFGIPQSRSHPHPIAPVLSWSKAHDVKTSERLEVPVIVGEKPLHSRLLKCRRQHRVEQPFAAQLMARQPGEKNG